MPGTERRCDRCEFFLPDEDTDSPFKDGYCHRHPQPIEVANAHWCGEFRPKPADLPPQRTYGVEVDGIAVSVRPGTSIEEAADAIVKLADERQERVVAVFNGKPIQARPGGDADAIAKDWYARSRL